MKTKTNGWLLFLALLLFIPAEAAKAQQEKPGVTVLRRTTVKKRSSKKIGIGAVLGNPTGLSANFLKPRNRSIDALLAFDLSGDRNIHFHSTYLFRFPRAMDLDGVKFGWFTGFGASAQIYDSKHRNKDDRFRLGPRGSIGMNYIIPRGAPVEFFGQIGLTMNVVPKTDADVDLGIGGRFYF